MVVLPVLVLPHNACPPTQLRPCPIKVSLLLQADELRALFSGCCTPTPGAVAQGNIRMPSPTQLLCSQCLQASYPPEPKTRRSMNAKQALLFGNSEMISLRKQCLWVVIALQFKCSVQVLKLRHEKMEHFQ